jgi:hypothetical protein
MKTSDVAMVKVDIKADPGTEIFLINSRFQRVAQGVGRLTAAVEPGLYKVKYRAGSRILEEHLEVVSGSSPVHLSAPSVPYYSSAPLATAQTTHEYHEDAAGKLSRTVHERVGEGSEIFVFARTWTEERHRRRVPPVPTNHHPAKGLTLRAADGSLLVDLAKASQRQLGNDPWAGCTVAVDPGAYRLRVDTPRWGALEQTIIASKGWQTQVFLLQDDFAEGPTSAGRRPEFRPDLSEASVLMARKGRGFDPANDDLRLVELARQSLVTGRNVFSPDDLDRLFTKKRTRPMLGIYGAHALLAQGTRRNIAEIVKALRTIVPGHPDVEALNLALASRPSMTQTFGMPPMLASSWSIIVAKSTKQPGLVPPGSLSSQIAPILWGNGPWLIWLADQLPAAAQTPMLSLSEALASIVGMADSIQLDPASIVDKLSDMEAALFSAVAPVGPRQSGSASGSGVVATSGFDRPMDVGPGFGGPIATPDAPVPPPEPPSADADPQRAYTALGRALGLPPSSLLVAADELSKKLSKL